MTKLNINDIWVKDNGAALPKTHVRVTSGDSVRDIRDKGKLVSTNSDKLKRDGFRLCEPKDAIANFEPLIGRPVIFRSAGRAQRTGVLDAVIYHDTEFVSGDDTLEIRCPRALVISGKRLEMCSVTLLNFVK